MTKDDLKKAVEDFFPSKRASLIIKCDTYDDSIDTDTENSSVTYEKERNKKLSDMHM